MTIRACNTLHQPYHDGQRRSRRRRIARSRRRHALTTRTQFAYLVPLLAIFSVDSPWTVAAEFQPTAQTTIVPAGAEFELVWSDGEFTEGPVVAADGAILFSDIGNKIWRFDPDRDKTTVFRDPSGRSNGLFFDANGRLIACEGANTGGRRRISVTESDGTVRTLADAYDGKRFNSPNDLAVDAAGRVYFTDPRYVGDEPRELDFEAVFLVTPDGDVRIASDEVEKPNGIVISPDGETVYVADHNPAGHRQLLAFSVAADGRLENKRVLFDFGERRGIDGMTIDTEGNVYATAGDGERAGIYVFGPAGEPLAFLATPGTPTNCVFGAGDGEKTLYVTAGVPADSDAAGNFGLYRIGLKKAGFRLFP